jgi:hypothetical protein
MGDKCIRHKRFTVGQSFVMTGIAHFFHLLAPHRLQFRFSAWGSMTMPVQQLRQACRISLREHTLAPYPVVEAPGLAEHYMRSQQCWFRHRVLVHSWGPKSLFN